MKLTLLTTFAIHAAFAAAISESESYNAKIKVMPKRLGAAKHVSDQPPYCYPPTTANYYCYKNGYPNCCTKGKGNCPNNVNNEPGCECDGGNTNCNPDSTPSSTPRTTRISPGGVCQTGVNVCENGYSCINGRCATTVITPIPQGGACIPGDTCADGFACLNGKCGTGEWYTNWSYCVMDCPSSDGPCCGGNAQSYDHLYPSAEACCGQSAFQGNPSGCTTVSLQCPDGDIDDQINVKVE